MLVVWGWGLRGSVLPSAVPPILLPQPKEDFKQMGQLMGMLGILCQDPDRATQLCSLQGLGHLYQLLLRHRGKALWATRRTHSYPNHSPR